MDEKVRSDGLEIDLSFALTQISSSPFILQLEVVRFSYSTLFAFNQLNVRGQRQTSLSNEKRMQGESLSEARKLKVG